MQAIGVGCMQHDPSKPAFQWDELMTAQEVADRVRVHVKTFRRWCLDGAGPVATMLGGVDRYAKSDVAAWLESKKRTA